MTKFIYNLNNTSIELNNNFEKFDKNSDHLNGFYELNAKKLVKSIISYTIINSCNKLKVQYC